MSNRKKNEMEKAHQIEIKEYHSAINKLKEWYPYNASFPSVSNLDKQIISKRLNILLFISSTVKLWNATRNFTIAVSSLISILKF